MALARLARSELQDLESATEPAARLQVLKRIKGIVTGHLSHKLEFVQNGLIPQLANVLADVAQRGFDADVPTQLDEQQESLLTQVAQVLSVIAHEGPPFVQPLLETDVPPRLVAFLLLSLSPRTTLAVLKCLNAAADNMPPSSPGQWSQNPMLSDLLYSKRYIRCFENVIGNAGNDLASQQACDAVLALLCKTITHDAQKRALVDHGVLDLLAARLASFVVAEGLVPPGLSALSSDDSAPAPLPYPAPSSAHLSPVLEALCVLTEGSRSRTKQFLTNPTIKSVFPDSKHDFSPSDIRRAPWGASYFSGAAVPRSRLESPFDALLPFAPVSEKADASHPGFPPLSSVMAMPKRRASFLPAPTGVPHLPLAQDVADDVDESAVIPWLLYVVRESRGKRRLLAAKLLVNLHSLHFVQRARSLSFASLLVPLLTRMLDNDQVQHDISYLHGGSYLCSGMHFTRAVPAVLAALVIDNPHMQRVAVEGKAITKLSLGLKATFDGPAGRKVTPWQPHKQDNVETDSTTAATCLGPGGPTWAARREMEYREGCLKALAAIAPFEEDYRAQICNEGVLPHIVQALEPYQAHPGASAEMDSTGNSASVILAACAAVRALGRSVRALRTKLVEAEVAKPILKLMNSTNPELRIAATKVLSNLAVDFSAVKDSVGESTVVKKLCEQAHSANARLRHESLWALKQLVLNAPKKLKLEVVDELGCSWIKLLIKTDPIDIPEGEVIGLVERDYPPATTYGGAGLVADNPHDVSMGEDSDSDGRSDEARSAVDEEVPSDQGEFDTKHTVEDDTEIQAQLLDLLRNLFCGENASEMVRYMVDEMGQDDFFRIMLDRLRPRTLAGPTRKENYTTPPPNVIVGKVLFVLVHIAACDPKWRNIIASQYALLKQILTLCNHPDREIRSTCCWIAINLTYEDDANDRAGCRNRAIELQKAGFVSHLRTMENDSDLDVRERAKTALHLMTNLKLMA
ncbi:armadillo repeat protein [Cladophialophora carrionii]|uniref:Armadillo repeat protein n=1 Tax=Cladophialophora carrionii TaxID=86049 RepID=A0A1C1CAK2_9EURO|nr:armadillo repeat protein [Cladophialophora carrionii]